MSQPLKNVIIIGAGGNLGPSILKALDSDPHFTVSILSRQNSKSTFPPHIKVHTIPDDYPEEQLIAAFTGQDAVVDLAPLYNIAHHKAFVDAAVKAGVKHFIPSDFGAKTTEPRVIEAVPAFSTMVEIREYLVSKESEGLTWTGVSNGSFFDWGLITGFIGFDLSTHKALIYDNGTEPADYTLLSDVGKAVASILLLHHLDHEKAPEDSVMKNKYVYINSFFVSQNAILEALELATGGDKWEVEHTTAKEANEEGRRRLGEGDIMGLVPAVMGCELSGEEWVHHYGKDNLSVLGRETMGKEELREVVGRIVRGEEV